MHFKLGKPKDKPGKDKVNVAIKDIAAERIEKMEQRIYGRTKDLEEKAQQIHGLTGNAEDIAARPHGPLGELTLEESDKLKDLTQVVKLTESDDTDEDEATVKLVEVSAINASPPVKAATGKIADVKASPAKPPATAKEAKPDDDNDSLGNLFNQQEEEINPLANLISSLPDVTAQELIDDLKEIKRIIKEWQVK